MSKVMKAPTKPAEYKDYVHFLGNYKNGKKDDCDSGINSPLDKSVNSSSTSVNSDLNSKDDVDNCVRLKTEITIEINNIPENKINNTSIKKNNVTSLHRKGSVKKMSEMFDNNDVKETKIKTTNVYNGNNKSKPLLEKLLQKDQNQYASDCNRTVSPKPPIGRITNNFTKNSKPKPSLEKLLQEDAINATQNITEAESGEPLNPASSNLIQQSPHKISYNGEATLNSENIFTTLRPKAVDEETIVKLNNIVVTEVVPPPLPPQQESISQNTTTTITTTTTNTVRNNTPSPPPELIITAPTNGSTNNAPPPPPPPMPAMLPTLKKGSTLPNPKLSNPNTNNAKDINDLLEAERKKLAYGALRGIMGSYHQQANIVASTLPRNTNVPNGRIGNIIQSMAKNGDLEKLSGRTMPKTE